MRGRSVVTDADRLEVMDRTAASHLVEKPVDLAGLVGRFEQRDVSADHFGGRVAIEPLRPGVPARDDPVERLADDRIVRVVDDRGELHPPLFGLPELGDVAGGGEDAGHLALLVAVDRRVVHDGPDRAVAVADAELVIADGAGSERGLVPGLGAGGIGEVGREVGPDQLVTRDTGHLDRRLVHIGDDPLGADRYERVEARLDQAPVVRHGTGARHLCWGRIGDPGVIVLLAALWIRPHGPWPDHARSSGAGSSLS